MQGNNMQGNNMPGNNMPGNNMQGNNMPCKWYPPKKGPFFYYMNVSMFQPVSYICKSFFDRLPRTFLLHLSK